MCILRFCLLIVVALALLVVGSSSSAIRAQEDELQPVCVREVNGKLVAFPGSCPELESSGTLAAPTSSKSDAGPSLEVSRVDETIRQIAGTADEQQALALFESLVGVGDDAVPALIALFENPGGDPTQRWIAGRALGRLPGPTSTKALKKGLKNDVPLVRLAAVKGLEDQRARAMVPELLKALDDKGAIVRAAVLDALGTLGSMKETARVAEELNAPHNFIKGKGLFVRVHAVTALERLGGPVAIEALIEVADDKDPATRSAAQAALLRLTGRSTVPAGAGSVKDRWKAWWSGQDQ